MAKNDKILRQNKEYYGKLYSKNESFLQYPAGWVIRFHNMYLKSHIPKGRVLDYGFGTGNNSIFFMEKGYDVYGVEVNDGGRELMKKNLERNHVNPKEIDKFTLIPPNNVKLPFKDNFFDVIISNQVLYYLSSEDQIRKVCKELHRILRPGGVVFFTVMGPKNYYIKYHAKQIHPGGVYEILVDDPKHRLYGNREFIYLVRDEEHLKDLFSDFKCLSTGYFDHAMFDMPSGFHWI